MSTRRDYYEILGVSRSSDGTELKKVYRKLALEYHPDRNPDNSEAEERFREIQEAYEVLSDPEKRQLYDQFGHEGLRSRGYEGPSMDDIFGGFQSIFEDFFGGGSGRRREARGRDMRYRMQLEFREAILGCTKNIEIPRHEKCSKCDGKKAEPGTELATCPTCQGAGQVRMTQGFFSIAQACPQCSGTGQYIPNPCRQCRGQGLEEKRAKLEVKVPAGVDTGIRLRVNGEGEASAKGRRGDLYVEIEVLPDEVFERDGSDLYTRIYISYPKAVLGGKVEVPLIEGSSEVEIPSQIDLPFIKEIPNEGVVDLQTAARGRLFVEVQVASPKKISRRAKELLEELEGELTLEKEAEAPRSEKEKKGFFENLFG